MSAERMARGVALVTVVALLTPACSDDPSGPGALGVAVEAPVSLGAVVIEVTGPGVTGFVGHGDTRAYAARTLTPEGGHRVALVDQAGGRIEFGIEVTDVAAELPVVTVIQAVDAANLAVSTQGIEVRIRR